MANTPRVSTRHVTRSRWMLVMLSVLASVAGGSSAWAISPTTTSLFITPESPASSAVVTMTAQVSSSEFTVSGGTVTFTDTYNGVTEPLGTIQVQSLNGAPGTAILKTEVGGVGTHQFVANFNGIVPFSASSSTTQSIVFSPTYSTATVLSSSGGVGNYTLNATVSAFGPVPPTGNVTFTDTTSNFILGTAALDPSTLLTGFAPYHAYPIANLDNGQTGGTIGPAIGDFNGDGYPDYAVPTNSGPIVILLGSGAGTFTNGTSITTTSPFEPTSAVVGDFNGDGKQDLAVLSADNIGSVNIYLGNGDGTFQTAKNYPVAASASASRLLAIGDFNRDGIQDLVATNSSLGQVAVLLGNGDGSFNSPLYNAVGSIPWNVVVGDINQDGILDLAVSSDGSNAVSVLVGNGDGTFQPVSYVTTDGSQAGSVALGDFNGDGYPDLATTSGPDNAVYVLLNLGTATPTFGASKKYAMKGAPYYLTIGDFNRDGKLDIISANNSNATVGVLLNKGTGTFSAATTYDVGSNAIFSNAADINGDDQIDLTAVTEKGLSVLLSGQTESTSIANVAFHGCGRQSASATYNGDGIYSASTSGISSFAFAKAATNVVLTVTPANGVTGQQILLQATLAPYNYGTTTTDGEVVTFYNNNGSIGTALLSGGVATLSVSLPFDGSDSFFAKYPGDCGFLTSSSNVIAGSTLRPTVITWPAPAAITYGTALDGTQLNATASRLGTFVYTPAAGTILDAGTTTLSATFTPINPLAGVETVTVQLTVNPAPSVITWPTPAAITYGTPLSDFQLDASASGGAVPVPLSSYYNVHGIYDPGSKYGTGGFDTDGYSYSTSTLTSTLVWNGFTFNLGPPNELDAVANRTIALPAGKFSTLNLLGAMVNNIGATQTFVITYTDNTTFTFTQNMSDWFNAAGWPGESVISCSEQRNFRDGNTQPDSVCVYGYQIPLDPTKTAQSVQLPPTRNIVFLSMDLATPSIPGTFVYTPPAGTVDPVGTDTLSVAFTPDNTRDYLPATATVQLLVESPVTPIVTPTIVWPTPADITWGTPLSGTQLDAQAIGLARPTPVSLNSQLQILSTSTDGQPFSLKGFDNAGHSYSYNQLGNGQVTFAGTTFTLGSPTVPNSITNGAVYTLPTPGNYATVYVLGAAIKTGQINEPFTLTYADGNGAVTQTVSMSSWHQPAGYAGESVVASTTYANTQAGGQLAGTYDLYGYQIPVDPTRSLVSVTLPNTRNVVVLALGFGTNTQVNVPGTYDYAPPAGTVLAVGSHPLNVTFTPDNSSGYTGATGSTTIQVDKAIPVLTWPTPGAVPVGTALSGVQLDATASFQVSPLPGTFTYTPAAGTVLTRGPHTLTVLFTPTDTTDFTTATATVQIEIGTVGAFSISGDPVFSSGDCCFFSQPTPYTITVNGSTAAPTGTVEVVFSGHVVATGTLNAGSGSSSSVTLAVDSSNFIPGNNSVTVRYLGDTNYVPARTTASISLRDPAIGVNPAPLGDNTVTVVPYTFVADGSIAFNFNPKSGSSGDFTDAGTGTCKSGVQAAAGTVCSLSVSFQPTLPGARRGVIEVDFTPANGGDTEPTLYLFLSGMGDAAQISLSTATQAILNRNLNSPQALTFNPADNTNSTLYVANSNIGRIDTLPSAGGALTRFDAAHTGNLVYPSDLVFDAFGDLVVSDANAAKVFSFSPTLAETTVKTTGFTLGLPTAAKVDLGGNLYIADAGDTPQIIEVPGETFASYKPAVVGLGSYSVSFPQALAVDNAGANLYVGDGNTNQILQIGLNGGGVTPLTLAPCDASVASCAINSPAGFAFDPNGDMFITDSGARVLMVPATHTGGSPTTQVAMTGLLNPTGITLDGSGNIYVTDLNGTVAELLVNTGALTINRLNNSKTTTLTNTGNLGLSISALTFLNGASSAFSETDNCTAAPIAPGGTCTITITYSNSGGAGTDALTITSNAFSQSGVTIQLKHN
jgi:FG-GAP-like repeat/Bacterial Ig-like domain (group 3)